MEAINQIVDSIRMGEEQLNNAAQALRWAASVHPEATRKQFIEAAGQCGYRENTARNRFYESRKFDATNYGALVSKDGRIEEY